MDGGLDGFGDKSSQSYIQLQRGKGHVVLNVVLPPSTGDERFVTIMVRITDCLVHGSACLCNCPHEPAVASALFYCVCTAAALR